jgi:hypothetical protein
MLGSRFDFGASSRGTVMTEAEWLAPENLVRLDFSDHVRQRRRKHRLFGIACARQLAPWIEEKVLFDALAKAEAFAAGELSEATLQTWRRKVQKSFDRRVAGGVEYGAPQTIAYPYVAKVCAEWRYANTIDCWRVMYYPASRFGEEFARRGPTLAHALLLDIFGNPFRPVEFLPAWRSDTVLALAKQMYESRDFGAMPILADALQDAGCDSEEILSHCRGEGPHVRGCWVVDLVLGKE